MTLIKLFLEILGWLQIACGTTLIAGIPAFVIYTYSSDNKSKLIPLLILLIGFISGAVWATRIWKKHGTIEWLSRIRKIS